MVGLLEAHKLETLNEVCVHLLVTNYFFESMLFLFVISVSFDIVYFHLKRPGIFLKAHNDFIYIVSPEWHTTIAVL